MESNTYQQVTGSVALRLFDAGFGGEIVELRPKSKIPRASGWQNARLERGAVERWPADANVGLRTGLFPCIDVDVDSERIASVARDAIASVIGDRAARRIGRAPRFAIVCKLEGAPFRKIVLSLRDRSGADLGKVEVLADGQQLAIAGIHPLTGAAYRHERGAQSGGAAVLADAFESLPALSSDTVTTGIAPALERALAPLGISVSVGRTATVDRAEIDQASLLAPSVAEAAALVESMPNVVETRDEWRNVAAAIRGSVGHEGDDEGEAAFVSWSEKWKGAQSEDPATLYGSLTRPVALGWDYLLDVASRSGVNTAALEFDAVDDAPPSADAAPVKRPPAVRSLASIAADPEMLKPPTPIIARIAYKGRTTLTAGREKSGKSTLVSGAVAAVSTGGLFLGESCEKGTVLWAGEENAGDLVRRFRHLGADEEAVFVLDLRAHGRDRIDLLCAAIEEFRPSLVVVDTLMTLLSGIVLDSSKDTQITPHIQRIAGLCARLGTACVLLHHTTKAGTGYHGSFAFAATVDLVMEMKAPGEAPTNRRNVTSIGRWDTEPFSVVFDPTSRTYVLAGAAASPIDRFLALVAQRPGITKSAIEKALGMRKEEVTRLRGACISDASIVDNGKGRNWALEINPNRPTGFDAVADPTLAEILESGSALEVSE